MPGSIQSIERAAAIIDLLQSSPRALRLGEIAEELHLPKATAHGIMRTLVSVAYVEQDDTGNYLPGPRLDHSTAAAIDPNDLRSASMGWADTLASVADNEVFIAVLHDQHALIAHHVFRPSDTPQRLRTGELLPLHATALGRVLLANSPVRERILRNMTLERFTHRTPSVRKSLAAELDRVRRAGISTCIGEYEPDRAEIAMPIRGRTASSVAAIAVSGPPQLLMHADERPRSEIATALAHCATAITRALGSSL
ncbi:MAG: IclR family transcriptional regulator [Gordonia sp. (in: high G+C Gram-positive bacteria)]